MKLILLILLLILIFALCYLMYKDSNTYYENLQNIDASYLIHDQDESDAFNKRIMNPNDSDLSGILQSGSLYDSTYFSDNSGTIYDISGIERDIKYFNNVSHILADYYSKNMVTNTNNKEKE